MKHWTDEEIAILREHYSKEGASVAERLPNRTDKAVPIKARRLGLSCKGYRGNWRPCWTPEETETLRQYYAREGQKVAKRLRHRTPSAVLHKARALGIARRFNCEHVWKAGMEGKFCAGCGDWRSVGEFRRAAHTKDGLGPRCKGCCTAYYYEHAEHHSQYDRAYRQSPRGRAVRQIAFAKRRLTERRGDLTSQQWEELVSQHAGCAYCGHPFDEDTRKLTLDHIIPVSRDGNYIKDNVLPVCLKCNCSKHTSLLGEEWLPWDLFDSAGQKITSS